MKSPLGALPELRAAAEAEASAVHNAWCAVVDLEPGWDGLPPVTRDNRIAAHLARLLDPNNPAAEGVLADVYRRVTGRESAYAFPVNGGSEWHILYPDPSTKHVQVSRHKARTRYEAWARALLAHYDLAARKDGSGF